MQRMGTVDIRQGDGRTMTEKDEEGIQLLSEGKRIIADRQKEK